MASLEKWMILTYLQKLPKNVQDLGKLIVAKGFENLSKFQLIAQSGHTPTRVIKTCEWFLTCKWQNILSISSPSRLALEIKLIPRSSG